MIEWSESQQMIRDAVRKFVETEIKPRLEELEHGDAPPYDVLRKMIRTFGMDEMARQRFRHQLEKDRAAEAARAKGASPAREEQMAEVGKVLEEIGANEVRQLVVFNKLDLTGLPPAVERDEYDRIFRVRLSAKCGDGLPLLREALAEIAQEKSTGASRATEVGADADQDNLEDEQNPSL